MICFLSLCGYRDRILATEREIDRLLVERAKQGDKRSFGMLVSKYQRKLFRLILRLVHNQTEAEDVVQETFIKAYRALHQFRGDAAFYTWLYRIGINTARNFLDNRGRKVLTATDMTAEQVESFGEGENLRDINTPESVLASKQIAQTVHLAIDDLPDDLRSALLLREVEGLSYEEIAMAMACPVGTVRSRIFRAREAVAVRLRPLLDTDVARRW